MKKARVAVIEQRLVDRVAPQQDMELAGIVDIAPNITLRALIEQGMP